MNRGALNVRGRTEHFAETQHDAILQSGSIASRRILMLYTIAIVLIVLWALGLVSAYTMGGFIHVLLVIAVVMILINLISGRRVI